MSYINKSFKSEFEKVTLVSLEQAIRDAQNELDRRSRMDDEFQGLVNMKFDDPTLVEITMKQGMLIESLLSEKDLNGTKYEGYTKPPAGLSKSQASEAITELLALPKLQKLSDPAPSAARHAAPEGVYYKNHTVFKVKLAVHGSGRPYAQALNPDTGRWAIEPGMVYRLTEADKLTLEQAAEFGRLYGICARCGRTLTDEESIAAGIGPVCAGRL